MAKIKTGHAKQLILNYVDNQAKKLVADETRAVWFSRKDILEILETDVKGKRPSGIRFYFAAYEQYDFTGQRRTPKYSQESARMTIVMVPTTMYDNNGNTKGHGYRANEKLHFDLLEEPNALPEYETEVDLEGNDGQICPPPPLNELLP